METVVDQQLLVNRAVSALLWELLIFGFLMVFFCNQKTAYEMRISDWSSDVCSSDLVVDQSGRLLSSAGGGGVAEASSKRIAVQNQLEARYRQSIATLLTPLVGAGNFTAEVHADVDFTETQATREPFPEEATTLRAEEGAYTTAKQIGRAHVYTP